MQTSTWLRAGLLATLFATLHPGAGLRAQDITPALQPNATQQALMNRGYGMFIHFGVNTFGEIDGPTAPSPRVSTPLPTSIPTNGCVWPATPASATFCSR